MAKLETRRADMEALTGRQGEVLGRSRPYSIQQLEEDAFAALIGDWDPMHNEPAWKFDAGWGGTIVLGFHVLSRAERFLRECGVPARSDEEGTFMTLGIGRARFMSPFPVGAEATCGVRLDSVEAGPDHLVIRTTLTNEYAGGPKPTMVAEHIGAFFWGRPSFTGILDDDEGPLIASIPSGTPIAPSAAHDEAFYAAVAARAGQWLGTTPWTVVEQRDADAFAILSAGLDPLYNDRAWAAEHGPFGHTIVRPLQVLALRSYFMPQVGLPVLSDERMAAFNYGLDGVRWYAPVEPGTPMRDHVLLQAVTEKDPGRYLIRTLHLVEARGQDRAVLRADCSSMFVVSPPGGR